MKNTKKWFFKYFLLCFRCHKQYFSFLASFGLGTATATGTKGCWPSLLQLELLYYYSYKMQQRLVLLHVPVAVATRQFWVKITKPLLKNSKKKWFFAKNGKMIFFLKNVKIGEKLIFRIKIPVSTHDYNVVLEFRRNFSATLDPPFYLTASQSKYGHRVQ